MQFLALVLMSIQKFNNNKLHDLELTVLNKLESINGKQIMKTIIISGDFDILGLSYKASLAHQQYQSTQYQIFPTTL